MLISSKACPELGSTGRRIGCRLMGHSLRIETCFRHAAGSLCFTKKRGVKQPLRLQQF